MDSVYTDSQGAFGFHSLQPEGYEVIVNDDQYQPVRVAAEIHPTSLSPTVFVDIRLVPKNEASGSDAPAPRQPGSNPNVVDVRDYSHVPKKAIKEYEKGLEAERKDEKDEAVRHYQATLKIAPDYYPAHNNLGVIYLGKAEEQFREAVRLDQNEGQAYLNLSNVLMLTNRLPEAETALAAGLQRSPDSAFGYFLQGCLYARAGKLAEEESSLQKALRLDPKMPQAYLQLVNLYLRENRREDAITQLQAFLKGFPTATVAPKAQEILIKLQKDEGAAKR
jgi:tetratricopeptide (TPR) repeat protein